MQKIQALKESYEELKATPVKDIWRRELVELRTAMAAFLKNSSLDAEDAELEELLKERQPKKKKTIIRKKKK